jgi:hypothetical protein
MTASTYALVAASLAALGLVTLLIRWLFMFSACPCAPTPATLPAVPALMLPGVKLVRPDPTPVNALLALFKVNALLYVPATVALGTVPLAKLLAFKLVNADPTPVNALLALFKVNALL